ncbi:hypothetical protein L596_011954 [Steinernema carpocapsae]|uniref:Uncharacterized protein n=1 Tax=Steinernema carpocapsae TaxID=34508 RepID=A0A4U5NWA1_STECR|nr:hypothetical protein L596_011954 [Steinernema carpocapsae]
MPAAGSSAAFRPAAKHNHTIHYTAGRVFSRHLLVKSWGFASTEGRKTEPPEGRVPVLITIVHLRRRVGNAVAALISRVMIKKTPGDDARGRQFRAPTAEMEPK